MVISNRLKNNSKQIVLIMGNKAVPCFEKQAMAIIIIIIILRDCLPSGLIRQIKKSDYNGR
jgi:hypothetical protein